MAQPLMPKATAVWLVENTTLTFEQVAAFCGLHELEVQAIADGEVAVGMVGLDPVGNGQLTRKEISRCEGNPNARLQMVVADLPQPVARSKGPRYTPITKRGDKPDGVAWVLKFHPELPEAAICRLIGTTKPTIAAVRDKTHWNAANIKPRSPVLLGLCTQRELEEALAQAVKLTGGKPQHDNSAVLTYDSDEDEGDKPGGFKAHGDFKGGAGSSDDDFSA